MTDTDRLSSPARLEEDGAEVSLRPQTLDDFTGQRGLRENLRVFIGAARADRKSTRLNSSHIQKSRMPSSA